MNQYHTGFDGPLPSEPPDDYEPDPREPICLMCGGPHMVGDCPKVQQRRKELAK
jgi:hypothetical protein